jgi:hypothetical protein
MIIRFRNHHATYHLRGIETYEDEGCWSPAFEAEFRVEGDITGWRGSLGLFPLGEATLIEPLGEFAATDGSALVDDPI